MRTLAIIAMLFSAQAFACPNLTGAYTCTYQDGSKEVMNVTQDTKGTVTTFSINGSEMIADGQARPVPDDANVKNGNFKSWCDDDVTLKGLLVGQYFNNGAYYGDLTLNVDFSLSGADLKQLASGDIKNDKGTTPITQETVCTKN